MGKKSRRKRFNRSPQAVLLRSFGAVTNDIVGQGETLMERRQILGIATLSWNLLCSNLGDYPALANSARDMVDHLRGDAVFNRVFPIVYAEVAERRREICPDLHVPIAEVGLVETDKGEQLILGFPEGIFDTVETPARG